MGLLDEVLSLEGALDRAGEKYDRLIERRRELARLTAAEAARAVTAPGSRLPGEPGVSPGGLPPTPPPASGVPAPAGAGRDQRGSGSGSDLASSSSSGGSGGGRGRLGGAVGARNRPGQFRARSYLENVCERTTFEGVPRPGNPFAEVQKDYVSVEGWVCPDGSEYYNPESFEKYLTKRSVTSQRGSKSTPGDIFTPANVGGTRDRPTTVAGTVPIFGGSTSAATGAASATPAAGPAGLSGDARAIVSALGDLRREVVETLRRPASGVEVRFQGGR